MKTLRIFFKWTLIVIGVLMLALIILFVAYQYFYYKELRSIKRDLNSIPNVSVLNIWGHNDIELEEIAARINIEGKGEIVLTNLSKDGFRYPSSVGISEIGGYSFTTFSCSSSIGIGSGLDIGENGQIGKIINIRFNTPKDVINNYHRILKVIDSLPHSPQLCYFSEENFEQYILIHNQKSKDQDPIFGLIGIESMFEYAKKLQWKNAECKN